MNKNEKTLELLQIHAKRLKDLLGLFGSPIGVTIDQSSSPNQTDQKIPMRFCQGLMRARHGEKSTITGENLTCPAAARAFGFKPLPEPLRTGKGLIGFGIVSDEKVAQQMFEGMTTLPPGSVKQLETFPLDMAENVPDIIIIEDEPEKLMWVALSYLHAHGGKRVQGSTAILQATCVDSCIIPFLENRMNYGLGCYGCRDATDMDPGEAIIGFPADDLDAIVAHLEYLERKAMPHSREKHALNTFNKDHPETGCASL